MRIPSHKNRCISNSVASRQHVSAEELRGRLEQLVGGVMTIRRSVLEPATVLSARNRADQQRFLSSVAFIADTSVELAYNFC